MVLTYCVGVLCASKELLQVDILELDTLLFTLTVKQALKYSIPKPNEAPVLGIYICRTGVFLCLVIIIVDVAGGELATIYIVLLVSY